VKSFSSTQPRHQTKSLIIEEEKNDTKRRYQAGAGKQGCNGEFQVS
jgi:hypothetical protein